MSGRNQQVEAAVRLALDRIDAYISNESVALPRKDLLQAANELLDHQSASVKTATLFLLYYWVTDPTWDANAVPVGTRGRYGDKLLCEELSLRNVTLHNRITAFAENLGWKGNVKNVRLANDPRFNGFFAAAATAKGKPTHVRALADYFACRFAESKVEPTPLPPVGPDVLTFARAKRLLHALLAIRSEGHVQQFLVAALLRVYRTRHGTTIKTHHPHAADRFDGAAGDIEEYQGDRLVRAYEVTVRDDWRSRVQDFKKKMDRHALPKCVIIVANVNADPEWSDPAVLSLKLDRYERDIAVLDITDVLHFLAPS